MLRRQSFPNGVFNPWKDVDRDNELSREGPKIRRRHLECYLEARLKSAKLLLLGEAVGYQGGHFSGLAMTSERILLGYQMEKGILPEHVFPDLEPQRTSKPEKMDKGFTEPTATIVWGALLNSGIKPNEFVLWNAFAWHPYESRKGLLSNRKPKVEELVAGQKVLAQFLELFPETKTVAVGKVATEALSQLGVRCTSVRHPAQGGAREFRRQINEMLDDRKGR
ncbi:uracil-DNA glycosylase [candidate division KSB1 bacterium]|nr:uracil-DNA glycosylase [candidate division KSB1 bacterium]NIR69816.1 uracil-DNA glycosylase [candidate division KSB1 bacterium]NIS25807.1 uracil-DNA glycosylase [candidate division KSB1 bacterium]NIT72681.1 uracil-DNA glycosylase [candidate division KSB1 bacterium]NIU26496.1 uracil-DNA glycosylase [candidate division KSB1 bacterium]